MNYSILLVVFGLSMAIVEAKMCFGNKTNGGVGEVYCKSKFCMKMTKLEAEDPHPLRESRRKLEQEEVIYGCPQRKGQPGYCSVNFTSFSIQKFLKMFLKHLLQMFSK
ncbi:hypothetical protein WR25_24313 [Diploscapter pachys]|uniref:Uncharacterized protein n=1 Tax=Diploscapter pachys TaxID=2018661 RepID=A0A2A2M062_9BILA|nr:hypothetical protein WR25_24313 [Diploscapter pachys]